MRKFDITVQEDRIVFDAEVNIDGVYVVSDVEPLVEDFCNKHGLRIKYWNGNCDAREGWVVLEKHLSMEEANALEEEWYETF